MIRVLLFGRLSELHATPEIELPLEESTSSPEAIRLKLTETDPKLGLALAEPQILIAVNQAIVSADYRLKDGDEIAFLPPVTGG